MNAKKLMTSCFLYFKILILFCLFSACAKKKIDTLILPPDYTDLPKPENAIQSTNK
jgi:hypothetical protein